MKVLVLFYSRTGTTRRVAEALRSRLDADIEEIHDARPRRGLLRGWLRSMIEARRASETAILPTSRSAARYDLVLLGTPVWAGAISSPLRTWINHHRRDLKKTAAFVTQRASGGPTAIAQLTNAFGLAPVASLVVNARDVASGAYGTQLEDFAERLAHACTQARRSS